MFFNELDILELRLNELKDAVDYFVIVEALQTFQEKDKPLYFQDNRQRFEKFKDKIIHVVVPKYREGYTWARETIQRNSIMKGLSQCELDDLIFISDVDEIIRASKIQEIADALFIEGHPAVALRMPIYRFYMNSLDPDIWWNAKATTYRHLKTITPEELRVSPKASVTKCLEDCGWHFTSIGGLQKHRLKTESYSHSELNHENYKSQSFVESWIRKFTIVEIDETFPQYLRNNLDQYDAYLYKPGRRYE
jgi:beta-1,4-mannosyl-glycoprotein beta-1,4-N-acetylglucosaminyltransferase